MVQNPPPTASKRKSKISLIICYVFAACSLCLLISNGDYKVHGRIIASDVYSYYNYLPGVFKYHRLDFNKLPMHSGWVRDQEGRVSQKMTMGLAFLYLPFYLIAWLYITITGLPNDEYSAPFSLMLSMGAIFYMLAGMLVLRRLLLKYFNDIVIAVGLCCLFFGTNLLYYTVYEGGMSHVYNFFLIASFISLSLSWHDKPSWKCSLLLGLLGGLIVLVRPSNAVVFILPLLYNTHSKNLLREKIQLIRNHFPKLLLLPLFAIIVWIPQMIYWYWATGNLIHYSYAGESFFFLRPHVILGLFSYRNGWLIYAPVMIFSLLGLIFLRERLSVWRWPVIVYLVLCIYIIFSWWCWWYVGFGMRPMIDLYPVLAFPLCAFIEKTIQWRRVFRIPLLLVICAFTLLGGFKTYQYRKGIIHFDGMTGKAYWNSFFRTETPDGKYYELLKSPNYQGAIKGRE